eukprot:gene28474-31624_t
MAIAKVCQYAKRSAFRLEFPCKVQQIQILSHEYKIATKLEIMISEADGDFTQVPFKRLGYLSFDSNERSNFQARELKSVNINVTALYVKLIVHRCHLIVHRCHVNKQNMYNQVGLIALNLIGEPVQPGIAMPPGGYLQLHPPITKDVTYYNQAAAHVADLNLDLHVDTVTAAKIRELAVLKDKAVANEDYDEAKRLKASIERLRVRGGSYLFFTATFRYIICYLPLPPEAKRLKAIIERLRVRGGSYLFFTATFRYIICYLPLPPEAKRLKAIIERLRVRGGSDLFFLVPYATFSATFRYIFRHLPLPPEAKRLKASIERLRVVGQKIAQLEARKRAAVEREDYDEAKLIKADMDKLRATGESAAGTEQMPRKNPDDIFNRVLKIGVGQLLQRIRRRSRRSSSKDQVYAERSAAGLQGTPPNAQAAENEAPPAYQHPPHPTHPPTSPLQRLSRPLRQLRRKGGMESQSNSQKSTQEAWKSPSQAMNERLLFGKASFSTGNGDYAAGGMESSKAQAYDERPAVGKGRYTPGQDDPGGGLGNPPGGPAAQGDIAPPPHVFLLPQNQDFCLP